jgi:hypothetical protein
MQVRHKARIRGWHRRHLPREKGIQLLPKAFLWLFVEALVAASVDKLVFVMLVRRARPLTWRLRSLLLQHPLFPSSFFPSFPSFPSSSLKSQKWREVSGVVFAGASFADSDCININMWITR